MPEYAILGANYDRLFWLDQEWATRHRSDFFPQNSLPEWLEAFGGFLRCRPSTPAFEALHSDYEFALQHLDDFGEAEFSPPDQADRLGQHLLRYCWWGLYPLTREGSLLERYYQKTDGDWERWARLFDHAGRSLAKINELEASVKDRVIGFFDWRLKVGEPTELEEVTFWLEAGCLDPEWRLEAYSQIPDTVTPQWWATRAQLEALHGMLAEHTAKVVECFTKLTDRLPNDMTDIPAEHAKPILQAGLASSDETVRRYAKRAQESLLSRGLLSIQD